MTWRFDNYYFMLHDLVGSLEGVMEVKEEEREKRKKERATETDTEPHDKDIVIDHSVVVSPSFVHVHVCDLFVDVLLSHSVALHHNLLLYAVICHELVSYIFVVAAVAVAVGAALLLVLVRGSCSYTCFCC